MHGYYKDGIRSELEGLPVSSRDGNMPCMTCAKSIDVPAGFVLHAVARTPKGRVSGWHIDGVYCDDHRKTRVTDGEIGRRDAAIAVKLGRIGRQYHAEKVRVKQVLGTGNGEME